MGIISFLEVNPDGYGSELSSTQKSDISADSEGVVMAKSPHVRPGSVQGTLGVSRHK